MHSDFSLNNAPDRKCLREKTTACISLFVFFRIRHGTFPYSYSGRDDAKIVQPSNTPTRLDTNMRVKLTIVTILSFSEHLAIANLSYQGSRLLSVGVPH